MINVPQWPCPKCGAIPDTRHHKRRCPEECTTVLEAWEWWQSLPDEEKYPSGRMYYAEACFGWFEHLCHKCGRCGYKWQTDTLDAEEVLDELPERPAE